MLNFSSSSHHQISSSVDMLIIITSLWEFHATLNRAGRAIVAALHDKNQVCLLTSSDLQTRLCPVSGLQSTIDLTFVHRDLLPNAAIYVGPHIGRDAWNDFVNNLDHRANYSVFRGFTRKMLGNGFTPGLVRSLILLPSGISLSFRRKNVACLSISFTSIIQHAFEPTITSHGSCK